LLINKEGISLIAKGNRGECIRVLVKGKNIILKVKKAEKMWLSELRFI